MPRKKVRRTNKFEMLEQRVLLSGDIFIITRDNDAVAEYTTSGTLVDTTLVSTSGNPSWIANSGSDLFVIDNGGLGVGEYTTSGGTVNASLISSLDNPEGLAATDSDLFIPSAINGTILEYTTSGSLVSNSLVSGLEEPDAIAVSGSTIFVANSDSDTIGAYTTSGTTINATLISGLNDPTALAVSGSDLFVMNYSTGTIAEYTTSGVLVSASLITGLAGTAGMAISGSDLFVVNPLSETVGEYNTSGATVNSTLITGLDGPYTLAIASVASVPNAPTDLTATQGTAPHHVALTWAAVDGATSYQVFRSTTDNFAGATKIQGGVTTDYFDDTTASPGVLYYYWVTARNTAGISPQSAVASGFIPLQAPSITVTDAPHHVQITWAAVTNATSYQIFRSTTNDVSTATKIIGGVTTDIFDDTSAMASTTYYYWVRAKNSLGNGLFSVAEIGMLS